MKNEQKLNAKEKKMRRVQRRIESRSVCVCVCVFPPFFSVAAGALNIKRGHVGK